MHLVDVRRTVVDVDTNSEHNERQTNPDVNSEPQHVTAVSEPFDLADLDRRIREIEALVKPHQFDRWHTLRRAAELTGIKQDTLGHWCRRDPDRIPVSERRKLRGTWFVSPAWVASQAALNPRKDTA